MIDFGAGRSVRPPAIFIYRKILILYYMTAHGGPNPATLGRDGDKGNTTD
jgi:hypothetical protein